MKKRRLSQRGKIALLVLGVLFFILCLYIIDAIRFKLNTDEVNDVYQLVINDEVVEPSRVITKSNYLFDHYGDDEREVSIPLNSVINLPEKFKLKNSAGELVYLDENNHLPDGKYTLEFKVKDNKYFYNLNVDNIVYTTIDCTNCYPGGFVVVNLFDLNSGEEFVVDANFKTSSDFFINNNYFVMPIDFDNQVAWTEVVLRNDKGATKFGFDIRESYRKDVELYIPGYEVKVLDDDEQAKYSEAISTISNERLFTRFVNPAIGYSSGSYGDVYYINGSKTPTLFHTGHDYVNVEGTSVGSTTNGKVILISENEVYGKYIVIDHGQGVVSSYYNLSETIVNEGDEVLVGQEIGKMGATGNVTGVHLHFEIHINGIDINPEIFLSNSINF